MRRGKRRKRLKKRACAYRRRLIARNRYHPADRLRAPRGSYSGVARRMPNDYKAAYNRIAKTRSGKEALSRYKKFWGIPYPPSIKQIKLPGGNKHEFLVGMGTSPKVLLANGPKGKATKIRTVKGKRIVATNKTGTRIYILNGRNARSNKRKLRFVGWAPETHYIPTNLMEKAGTFKKGKYWIHKMGEERNGVWPKVYQDNAGNFIYGPGTYRVGKWIIN